MHLEVFSEGNSFIHRLDPRTKLLGYIWFALTIALSTGLMLPFKGLLFGLLLLLLSRISIFEVLKRMFMVNIFLVPIWILVPMDAHGKLLFMLGPYRATVEGVYEVISITLKANAIVLGGIVMLGTTDLFALAHAMAHLGMPKRLVYLFFIFFRYLTLLHDEYLRLKRAMVARAFVPKTNLHTYRTFAYLVGMLILRSYERAERLYRAMLARGFRGTFPIYRHFRFTRLDLAGAGAFIATAFIFYLV